MSRARKGQRGLDRAKTNRADRDAHRRRLSARRDAPPPRDSVRELTLDLLESGLGELAALRKRYGEHRDFDLVELHQRRLIDALAGGARA